MALEDAAHMAAASGRASLAGDPGTGSLSLVSARREGQEVCLSCLRPGLPGTGHRAGVTETSGSRVSPDVPGSPRNAAGFGPVC